MIEIKAVALPQTIEEYQLALNAAFAGGAAYGKAKLESETEFAWRSIKEYEDDIGYQVSDAFQIGWNMARTKASLFKS
jgi:hypothetical protein